MSILKLFRYVGKFKKTSLLAPLFTMVEVVFDIVIPYLMSRIVDVGILNKYIGAVVRYGMLMVLSAIVAMILGVFSARFATYSSAGFAMNIRQTLFSKVQDFSFANLDKFTTASLTTRLTTDIQFLQITYQLTLRMLVRAPLMMILATLMALNINKELALVFLVAIPILATSFFLIILKAHPMFVRMLSKVDRLNKSVQETLIAIRVVKAFVRRDYENEKFSLSATELRNAQLSAERIVILNSPIMILTMDACILAILWFGGNKMIIGEMLPGALFSFLTYTVQIVMSLMFISIVFTMYVISQASADRVLEVLNDKITLTDDDADPNLKVADGEVEFRNADFSYSGKGDNLTLTDINLHILPGQKVGIIGGTGSAKTTLVQLIPRLYDVYSGKSW